MNKKQLMLYAEGLLKTADPGMAFTLPQPKLKMPTEAAKPPLMAAPAAAPSPPKYTPSGLAMTPTRAPYAKDWTQLSHEQGFHSGDDPNNYGAMDSMGAGFRGFGGMLSGTAQSMAGAVAHPFAAAFDATGAPGAGGASEAVGDFRTIASDRARRGAHQFLHNTHSRALDSRMNAEAGADGIGGTAASAEQFAHNLVPMATGMGGSKGATPPLRVPGARLATPGNLGIASSIGAGGVDMARQAAGDVPRNVPDEGQLSAPAPDISGPGVGKPMYQTAPNVQRNNELYGQPDSPGMAEPQPGETAADLMSSGPTEQSAADLMGQGQQQPQDLASGPLGQELGQQPQDLASGALGQDLASQSQPASTEPGAAALGQELPGQPQPGELPPDFEQMHPTDQLKHIQSLPPEQQTQVTKDLISKAPTNYVESIAPGASPEEQQQIIGGLSARVQAGKLEPDDVQRGVQQMMKEHMPGTAAASEGAANGVVGPTAAAGAAGQPGGEQGGPHWIQQLFDGFMKLPPMMKMGLIMGVPMAIMGLGGHLLGGHGLLGSLLGLAAGAAGAYGLGMFDGLLGKPQGGAQPAAPPAGKAPMGGGMQLPSEPKPGASTAPMGGGMQLPPYQGSQQAAQQPPAKPAAMPPAISQLSPHLQQAYQGLSPQDQQIIQGIYADGQIEPAGMFGPSNEQQQLLDLFKRAPANVRQSVEQAPEAAGSLDLARQYGYL